MDRPHSSKIDPIQPQCRHPGRKGSGVESGLALVGFEDREPFFEDGTCPLPPIIEVATNDERGPSVHPAIDSVAGAPDLAPTICFEQAEMQGEGV